MYELKTILDADEFYFNGHWLSDFDGIIISKGNQSLPFVLSQDTKTEKILGVDGEIECCSNYNPRTFEVSVVFTNLEDNNIRSIAKWLSATESQWFYYKDDDVKIKCKLDGSIDLEHGVYESMLAGVVQLKFIAYDPFYYAINPVKIVKLNGFENIRLYNTGSEKCDTKITIYGNGNIEENNFKISNVEKNIIIESKYYNIYSIDDKSNRKHKELDFEGQPIILNCGENKLSFKGDVNKIIIEYVPKWI